MQQILLMVIIGSSLQKSVNKLTPKKFYDIGSWSLSLASFSILGEELQLSGRVKEINEEVPGLFPSPGNFK